MAKTKATKSETTAAPKAKAKKATAKPKASAKTAAAKTTKAAKPKAAKTKKPAASKAKKSNGSAKAPALAPTHEQIAAKAYEIWVSKGQPLGQDEANWAEAEAALTSGK